MHQYKKVLNLNKEGNQQEEMLQLKIKILKTICCQVYYCTAIKVLMRNYKKLSKVTFHAATVIAFVALRRFAAEQKKCSVETSALTKNWCINLIRQTHLIVIQETKCWLTQINWTSSVSISAATAVSTQCEFSWPKKYEEASLHSTQTPLTCSRKTIGRRHISHSSSGSSGRPLRLSHAGFPPTLLGNCGDRSRHGSASSRKPRTTSAESLSPLPDIVAMLSPFTRTNYEKDLLRREGILSKNCHNITKFSTWAWVQLRKASETKHRRLFVPLTLCVLMRRQER